jgi:LCP family protein required for cell wall assembly
MEERPRSAAPLAAAAAAILSFCLPGLGQMAIGARRRGLLIAVPVLLLLLVVAGIWFFDRRLFVRIGLSPELLLVVVAISLVVLAYRVWAIVDAFLLANRASRRRWSAPAAIGSVAVLALVLGATLFMHGWVASVGWSARETLLAVFGDAPPGIARETASPTPAEPTPEPTNGATPVPTPVPTPSPTPVPNWAQDGRLNVLLIGSDAGPGRWSMRADAIILVTVQIDSGRMAAFSVPRYTRGVPLADPAASAFDCGCLMDDYFNALYVYANQHPDIFPGTDEADRGLTALQGAAEEFFGVQLDGMAVADLNGFVDLVDAIGGVTIDVPVALYDAEYPNPDGSGTMELTIPAGEQHLDGWHALAFARTRHQDGDVGRMGRQQITIKALQREIQCNILGKLPAVLDVARQSLWTNLPLEDVPDMLAIHPGPLESHLLFDTYNVTLTPDDVARVHADVADAFDGPAPADEPELDC